MNETMLPMRTKSTRNHIKDTFLVMLKKKPFLKIRITALCQKAGITRATFYAHYLDIYDGDGVYDGSDHGSDCQRIQPYPCLYDE